MVDLIMQLFPESFSHFVLNFNMNNREKALPKLLTMSRIIEKNLKSKGKIILIINNAKRKNKRPNKYVSKGKGKEVTRLKPTAYALKPD